MLPTPLFLEWLFEFSIFGILRILIFCAIGIFIGVLIRHYLFRPKNEIMYCRERDGRGLSLGINEEDAISLVTNTNPALRFYKYGRSYEFRKYSRAFTRFFGKEGTAYTWILQGFGAKAKAITLKFNTLEEAVKSKWDKLYDSVPEEMKALLRENKLLVTVNLEKGITPKGYTPVTESTIQDKSDEDAAALWANSLKGVTKGELVEKLAYIGTGGCLVFVGLLLLGVIG